MDTSISSYGSKSRREMFEEQLKELQRDISSLSHKLSVPSLVATNRINSMKNNGTGVETTSSNIVTPAIKTSVTENHSFSFKGIDTSRSNDYSYLSTASNVSSQNVLNMPANAQLSSQDIKFQQSRFELLATELKDTLRQRDDAQRQLEQLRQENDELKNHLSDYSHIKAAYETLKHDHESLKISFQSCERIRIQQKELIDVLQRSQVLVGGTVGDNGSIASFNSVSSISHTAGGSATYGMGTNLFPAQNPQMNNIGSIRSLDDSTSQNSSVLPTVFSNINASMSASHRTGTIPSSNSSVNSVKHNQEISAISEHQDWLNTAVPTVVTIPRNRTAKGRSAGRPPRSSTSAPSSQQLSAVTASPTMKRRPNTPPSKGKQISSKNHVVGGVPRYLVSSGRIDTSGVTNSPLDHYSTLHQPKTSTLSAKSGDHMQFLDTSYFQNPQPTMKSISDTTATSSAQLKDPQQTSTMLTSLLLNQSPVRVTKTPVITQSAPKRSSSKKKLTRRSSSASSTQAQSNVSSRHTTHITNSQTHQKKTLSCSKSAKEPLIDEKTGVRILYRPVSSPSSSFSRARRLG